ncbi:MAG: Crp/Fnr family transcriptional regulator [Chloroflexota bacterium]|nr:Crp/Fnr family transcriptional regulator [Chloroflexota bacterium]
MQPSEKTKLIQQTLLFSALSEAELLTLADLATVRNLSPGEPIHWEGDPPNWFYIVAEGKVKIAKYASSGKELIVAIFTPGHTFGEVAVFDGIPYPASAAAVGEATVLGIRRDDLLTFMSQNPAVALKIINMLGGRIRDAHDRLRDMAGERVDQRIASMLLMLSSKIGLTIPFTRQEIADMTGITTETAIRVTTRLKDQGIISTGRGEITILDETKLRALSEGFSPV